MEINKINEYTLEEVFDFFPDAKFITQDNNVYIRLWSYKPYTVNNGKCWVSTEVEELAVITNIKIKEFEELNWRECIAERPVDYSKWIGKLCWFWHYDDKRRIIAILNSIEKCDYEPRYWFRTLSDNILNDYGINCKPLTEEEVKQYIYKGE